MGSGRYLPSHFSLAIPMTLVSTERKYTGKVVSLDLDTVRFP